MKIDIQKIKRYFYLGNTVETLIDKGDFKKARMSSFKILGIAIFTGIVFPLELIYIVCNSEHWEGSNSETILVISSFFILSIYPFYLFFALRRKIKNAEIKLIQEIRKESPEYLLSCLKKAIDERCVLTPIEDGVCVDTLTEIYLKEKAIGEKEGFIPVILQLDNNLIDNIEMNWPKYYAQIDNDDELAKQMVEELKQMYEEDSLEEWDKLLGNENETEGECLDGIDGVDFFWGRFVMARIPSTNPSDVFYYLPIGEWNDCPLPNVHQAMARHWNKRYKAVPCVITGSSVMYYVPQPVDKDSSFNLALEHTAYSLDALTQILMTTVHDYAKQLEKSTFWYFWWD